MAALHLVQAGQLTMLTDFGLPRSASPARFVNVNGILFFVTDVEWSRLRSGELWRSAGTFRVKEVRPDGDLVNVKGTLFFTSHDDARGGGLWKRDGTIAGTVQAKSFLRFTVSSDSYQTTSNGALLFAADDGVHGVQLWKYEPDINGLSVRHSGSHIMVTWPSVNTAGFVLEQTGTLNAPESWVPNTVPVTDDGVKKSVTVPVTSNTQFFRLRR